MPNADTTDNPNDYMPATDADGARLPSVLDSMQEYNLAKLDPIDGAVMVALPEDDKVADGSGSDEVADGSGSDEVADGSGSDEVADGSGSDEVADGSGSDEVADGSGSEEVADGSGSEEVADGSGSEEDALEGPATVSLYDIMLMMVLAPSKVFLLVKISRLRVLLLYFLVLEMKKRWFQLCQILRLRILMITYL